jgi:inner membrane protein
LIGAIFAGRRTWPSRVALVVGLLYIGLGVAQHARAASAQRTLAAQRGHQIERGRVMPTLGNLILWRSVYQHDGQLYADAVRNVPWQATLVKEGSALPVVSADDLPAFQAQPQRAREVFLRFSAFATGMVGAVPGTTSGITVGDMRYSIDTAGFEPLWGLRLDPHDPIDPVRAVGFFGRRRALSAFWQELTRPGSDYRSLEHHTATPSPES